MEIKNREGKVLFTFKTTAKGIIRHDAFESLDLSEAVFDGLILEGAQFSEAEKLIHASFIDADLYWASFLMVDASHSVFDRADTRGASFTSAILRECRFIGANLQHDNLGGFANFSEADLCGANFSNTLLEGNNFVGAKYDAETIFPRGFSPEKHDMIYVDDKESG